MFDFQHAASALAEVIGTLLFMAVIVAILEVVLWLIFVRWRHSRLALPIMLVAPAAAGLLVFYVYPLLWELNVSFTTMSIRNFKIPGLLGLDKNMFIGLNNYSNVFTGNVLKETGFWQLFVQTIIWTVVNVFFHVTGGIGLALLLNRKLRGRNIYRALLILPWAIPALISLQIWRTEYNQQFGAVNQVLGIFGVPAVPWLSDPFWNFVAMIMTNVWLGIPFMMVITLGGLQSISRDYYEAAEIDGANRRHSFRRITLPLLRPVLVPAILLGTFLTFNNIQVLVLHQPERARDQRHPGHRPVPGGVPVQSLRVRGRLRLHHLWRVAGVHDLLHPPDECAEGGLRMTAITERPAAVARPSLLSRLAGPARRGEDNRLIRTAVHLVLIFASVIAVFPVIRVLGVALRPGDRLLDPTFSIIPEGATLDAFHHVLFETPLFQWLFNSLLITVGTATVGLIFAATSAYAFSRYKFRGRGLGLTFLFATQIIPGIMLLVPIYLLAVQFQLVATYRGLVIAYSVTSIPFSVWILKGYYDTVPVDLEEAARIDGCSEFEAFRRVLLPLSLPALMIVFLFNFLAAWGEFFTASVLIGSKEGLLTWALGLQRMQGQFQTQWADLSAASILISVPVVILFVWSSKYLVSGLTLGGVKG